MRPPCSRTGFNFNLFNVGKLVQHVCVKLLWHSVLLWKGIVSSRHEYQQKKVAFFPVHYVILSWGLWALPRSRRENTPNTGSFSFIYDADIPLSCSASKIILTACFNIRYTLL